MQYDISNVHPQCSRCQPFLPFYWWITLHCMYVPLLFIHSSMDGRLGGCFILFTHHMTQPFELNLFAERKLPLCPALFTFLGGNLLFMDPCILCKSKFMISHILLVILTLTSCINHVFYFLEFDALLSGTLLTLEGQSLPGITNSERQWTAYLLVYSSNATNQSRAPEHTTPVLGSHTLDHCPPAPLTLRPGARQPRCPLCPETAQTVQISQLQACWSCLPCLALSFPWKLQ